MRFSAIFFAAFVLIIPCYSFANIAPVADAGPMIYAGDVPAQLDGSGSYDPDGPVTLTYHWRQLTGPGIFIAGSDTATPVISEFVQNPIQKTECTFELIVNDGLVDSEPSIAVVNIVRYYGVKELYLANPPFDVDKPTIVAFNGGNCVDGGAMEFGGTWEQANWITANYRPTYEYYGDKLIVLLSSLAPVYDEQIQTMGFSTGNMPAVDVAIRINQYQDSRYNVNRISFLDAACRSYQEYIDTYLAGCLEGEQCWIDNYMATYASYQSGVLNIDFPAPAEHATPVYWYMNSAYSGYWPGGDKYAHGVTGGYYYSVIGPGRNLQLADDTSPYYFKWVDASPEYLVKYNVNYPGQLPEAVTLVGPADGSTIGTGGVVLSCATSENAVGYELLFGRDEHNMDYVISDTASPPTATVTHFPYERTWWTVRAYDAYGSTIFADPISFFVPNLVVGDFNGDGNVDFEDFIILAGGWLGAPDNSFTDIGPAPNGDGIVDVHDFAVFAGQWQE